MALEKDKTYNVRLKGIIEGRQVLTSVKVSDTISQLKLAKTIRQTLLTDNNSIEQQAGTQLPLAEVTSFYIFSQGEDTFLIPDSWIESSLLIEVNKTLYLTLENISSPLEADLVQYLNDMRIVYRITK